MKTTIVVEAADEASAVREGRANGIKVDRVTPTKSLSGGTCANCDRKIGKLEQGVMHGDAVVCPECAARLKPQSGAGGPERASDRVAAGFEKRVASERSWRWVFWLITVVFLLAVAGVVYNYVAKSKAEMSKLESFTR